MAISEVKMQIVIDNYFKSECDTDTSIRQAFEKGFRIGAEKGASMNSPLIEIDLVRCGECEYADEYNHCKYLMWWNGNADFCSHGIRRKENR